MKIVSVQVGVPRTVTWKGKEVSTGIYKDPVAGRVAVGSFNLAGDAQADLSVHGGAFKSVYSYASEHYPFWKKARPQDALVNGIFGENLTTEGLDEASINVGDRFRFGTALLEAVEPRFPCFKLQIRFNDESILKEFLDSGRLGIYYRVLEPGEVWAGAPITREHEDKSGLKVFAIGDAKRNLGDVKKILTAMSRHARINPNWQEWAQDRLARLTP